MYQYLIGFVCGFISAYSYMFINNIYIKYKKNKNTQKAITEQIFNMYSKRMFNLIYHEIESNLANSSEQINYNDIFDIFIIANDILDVSKQYNKKFKIIIKNGTPTIKILDESYLNNKQFVNILQFLNQNSIELNILNILNQN